MRKLLFVFVTFLALFVFPLFFPAFAAESIQHYDATLNVDRSGKLFVEEMIQYDFGTSQRHGIYRYIPTLSGVGKLYKVSPITVTKILRDGKSEQYAITKDSEQIQVKIGDPNRTLTGPHLYTIDYTVSNIIGNFNDHDEIYWNVTGNGWNVPIPIVQTQVKTNFGLLPDDAVCYTGVGGSKSSDCLISSSKDGVTISTNKILELGEGLTVAVAFPPNTFPKTKLQKDTPGTITTIRFLQIAGIVYAFLNIVLAPFLVFWYNKHKHKNQFGAVSVNFDIPKLPEGSILIPAEAGSIDNAKLDKDDIVATIFDLAIKKYIAIEGIPEKNFLGFGSHTQYEAKKLKDFSDLSAFEKKVTSVIFNGSEVAILNNIKFTYENFSDLEEKNFSSLVKKGVYTKNPKAQMGLLLTLGILLTITGNIFLGPLLIFLSRKLNGRTKLGDQLEHNIDGLKIFLKNMGREYTWQAEKAYTVEQMIPYAISLGLIHDFMKQLKIINPNYEPSWYSGTGSFYSAYPIFYSSMSNAISTSSSGSGSGFSGGSSGGGGGGGGGGSW